MVRKTILILMILLVIPVSLALVTSDVPERTSEEELCITAVTGSGEIIKFYINDAQYQTIELEDGRQVTEIDAAAGGEFTGCINLQSGENKVEVKYRHGETEEFTVNLDTSAPQLTIDVGDVVNTKKIILSVDEDSTLTIVINGQITTEDVEAGNPEITLDLNEGENTVKIDVMDGLGNNITILDKIITLDSEKPVVEIISVDGQEDIIRVQTNIQIVTIIGKTDPDVSLVAYNLFDNRTYYYDKDEDKFLKSRNGEEITVFSMEGVDLDNGNFEAYVDLLPGKNTIVLLATDSANNKNTMSQAVNNIEPTLFVDYESTSEHWDVIARPASKIKALDILQKSFTAIVQVEFYPKDIDPGRLEDIGFSIAVPGQGENIRENQLMITASGQRQQPYYDVENGKYVTYQNINVQWPDPDIETVPRRVLTSLNGTITFGVGDRRRLITETVSFDILFEIETIQGRYLNPRRMRVMSEKLEDSLKGIRKVVQGLQKATMYSAMGCAALKFYNNVIRRIFGGRASSPEKFAEYLVCDRVLCYDTPPVKPNIVGPLPLATYYTKGRQATPTKPEGADFFHQTACPENIFRTKTNPYAPVRLKHGMGDLYSSTRCACLPGIWQNLQHTYATLSAIQNCMDQARRGTTDPAQCEVQIARASCSLSFWALEEFVLDYDPFEGRNYFVRGGGSVISDIKDIWNIRNLPQTLKINEDQLTALMYFYSSELYEEICVTAASLDWSKAKDLIKRNAFEAIPSYGKLYVTSIIEEEDGELVVKYQIVPGIAAGTHSVRYRMNFQCVGNDPLCKGVRPSYISNLQPQDYLSGTISTGISLQQTIYLTDENPEFLYNSVDLELEWYVTDLQRTFTYNVTSTITQPKQQLMKECKKPKFKNQNLKICMKAGMQMSGTDGHENMQMLAEGGGDNTHSVTFTGTLKAACAMPIIEGKVMIHDQDANGDMIMGASTTTFDNGKFTIEASVPKDHTNFMLMVSEGAKCGMPNMIHQSEMVTKTLSSRNTLDFGVIELIQLEEQ